jgi:hypothetical protein
MYVSKSQGGTSHFRTTENRIWSSPRRNSFSSHIYNKWVDLEEWTNHSSILTYADDTSTSCHGKSQEEVMEKLEEDKKHFTIHGIK